MRIECDDADEDDEPPGPCCLRPRFVLIFNVVAVTAIALAFGVSYALSLQIEDMKHELQNVHVQEFTLEGVIRPQFFTFNSSGEWSVPSGIYLSSDSKMYSRSWCTFSENTRTARVDFIVQGVAETSSQQLNTGVEFRFEIPFGLPIGEVPGTTVEHSRCPFPQCGAADYRNGVGSMGAFTNMESAFFTMGQVTQNRTRMAPAPIVCGCSMEDPRRFSCSFPGNQLLPIDGELGLIGTILYPTASKTVPPVGIVSKNEK